MRWRSVVFLTIGLVCLLVLLVIGSRDLYLILIGTGCVVAAIREELVRPRPPVTHERARHDYRHAQRLDHARRQRDNS